MSTTPIEFKPKQVVKALLGSLPERSCDVITSRYGLGKNTEKKFYNLNGNLIYTIRYKNEKEISVKTETWPHFIDEYLELNDFNLKHFKLIEDEPFIKLKTEKHKMSKDEILLANINRYFIYERI